MTYTHTHIYIYINTYVCNHLRSRAWAEGLGCRARTRRWSVAAMARDARIPRSKCFMTHAQGFTEWAPSGCTQEVHKVSPPQATCPDASRIPMMRPHWGINNPCSHKAHNPLEDYGVAGGFLFYLLGCQVLLAPARPSCTGPRGTICRGPAHRGTCVGKAVHDPDSVSCPFAWLCAVWM